MLNILQRMEWTMVARIAILVGISAAALFLLLEKTTTASYRV
jgi:hypothetical protein